jgi:hypothetical protein
VAELVDALDLGSSEESCESSSLSVRIFKRLLQNYINKRVGRIELPSSAWKAEVLPLNYTRY